MPPRPGRTRTPTPAVVPWTMEVSPIDRVRPHPENPRQGDVGAIAESLDANGFYGAVLAQRSTGHILAGNHRWKAAKASGMTEIPVMWLDVDDARALRILLVDNRDADLASYDDAGRVKLLERIIAEAGSLAGTGYDADDLDALLRDLGQGGGMVEGSEYSGPIAFDVTVRVGTAEARDAFVAELAAAGRTAMVKVVHMGDET